MPWRTLYPLPRFSPFFSTRRFAMRSAKEAATSAVRSVEPSSTTSTSVLRFEALKYAAMSSKDRGRRRSSLKDGTMMESWNAEAARSGEGLVISFKPGSRPEGAFPRRAYSEFPQSAKERNHTLVLDYKSGEKYG